MRVSGLVLLGLALGHLVLMHLIHNVEGIDYAFVARRYVGWFWRSYDLLMLVLALLHGFNGVRILIDDYIHPRAWRQVATVTLYVVGGSFLILGTGAIVLFHPAGVLP